MATAVDAVTGAPSFPIAAVQADVRSRTSVIPARLHALTSLRFIAAAMIVVYHTRDAFGYPHLLTHFPLAQGVSFFFILSGFILMHVYGSLDRRRIGRFFVARFARLWPMHFVSFMIFAVTLPGGIALYTSRAMLGPVVANLSFLEVWGYPFLYFPGNTGAWSISTEFFFYLCFPLLLWRWSKTWLVKIVLALLLVVALVGFANYVLAHHPTTNSVAGITYIHPLARLLEFVLGMATARLWRRWAESVTPSRRAATALELGIVALMLITMYVSAGWARSLQHFPFIAVPGEIWLENSGITMLPIACLIGVIALGRGWVARILSFGPLVLLGEISYSMYLLHYSLFIFWHAHPIVFSVLPHGVQYPAYFIVLLLISYLCWSLVEFRCRDGILALWAFVTMRGASRPQRVAPEIQAGSRRPLTAPTLMRSAAVAGTLIAIAATFFWVTPSSEVAVLTVDRPPLALVDIVNGIRPAPNRAVVLSRSATPGGSVTIYGYSLDLANSALVRGVVVSVDDEAQYAAQYGQARNDVATVFHDDHYLNSGFVATIPMSHLADGPHTIKIAAKPQDVNAYEQALTISLVVTP